MLTGWDEPYSTPFRKLLVHPKALAQQRTTEISAGCGNLQALA